MYNTNMLNTISYIAIVVTLIVVSVLLWELWKARIIPPFRIERAKHPRWYWSCIVAHAVVVAFMVVVGVVLALTSFFNDFFN
jgi:uncharacterized membrane protein YidH (DUF202 family)